jgi:hypothetical protein
MDEEEPGGGTSLGSYPLVGGAPVTSVCRRTAGARRRSHGGDDNARQREEDGPAGPVSGHCALRPSAQCLVLFSCFCFAFSLFLFC